MKNYRIAVFVSPHGFGHAARASALMQALSRLSRAYEFEIFTSVPEWFFRESVDGIIYYHELVCDIGLVQRNSLQEDLPQTIERLGGLYPFDASRLKTLAGQVRDLGCDCVVCDIAPLGIAVAQMAGLPSILVENFTWDWIYEGYVDEYPALRQYIDLLRELFESADYHVQSEPICRPALADLVVRPMSRELRTPRAIIRQRMRVPDNAKMVLVTMGGIPEEHAFVDRLAEIQETVFVIPGAGTLLEKRGTVILLPHHSEFYHPDLVAAADLVVGKSGYSTLAEVYYAGVPFGYVSRPKFREAEVMGQFVKEQMQGLEIQQDELKNGSWVEKLPDLLAMSRIDRFEVNGSVQTARFVHRL